MDADDVRADLMADGSMSVRQASEFSGIPKSTLYEVMDAGRLAYAKAGRRRLIPRKALVAYLAAAVVSTGRQ